jgi:acetolactate synthase-1/2/3 large subunit
VSAVGSLLAAAQRPCLVLGSDVWPDGAETAALRLAETTGVPVPVTNGMGEASSRRHPQLVTRRAARRSPAPTWSSSGTALDFRLGYGVLRRA